MDDLFLEFVVNYFYMLIEWKYLSNFTETILS